MKSRTLKISLNAVLYLVAAFQIYPFLLMIFGSFKSPEELSANPGGFPLAPTFKNYDDLFVYNGDLVWSGLKNSLIITALSVLITLAFSTIAAFAFAKMRFRGKRTIFMLLLATMMIPMEVLLPPMYIMFSNIGWLNTLSVQILPGTANVFALYMLKQYMASISDSVLEAARIDGAGYFQTFIRVATPMSAPAIGAVSVLLALTKWNDFLWPAMMITRKQVMPFMVILPQLGTSSSSVFVTPWTLLLAGCTIGVLPIMALFLCAQDKMMTSVTIGAVKE